MNKRVVIFVVLLASMLLSAAAAWPATLTVWNYTGDNVYIKLEKYGVMKYFLTATVEGNSADRNKSVFDIDRKSYDATVTACGVTTSSGLMDINTNLRLVFTSCDAMKQFWTPKYWGEPSQEKVNFFVDGDVVWDKWVERYGDYTDPAAHFIKDMDGEPGPFTGWYFSNPWAGWYADLTTKNSFNFLYSVQP